jgi:hypothetical protein
LFRYTVKKPQPSPAPVIESTPAAVPHEVATPATEPTSVPLVDPMRSSNNGLYAGASPSPLYAPSPSQVPANYGGAPNYYPPPQPSNFSLNQPTFPAAQPYTVSSNAYQAPPQQYGAPASNLYAPLVPPSANLYGQHAQQVPASPAGPPALSAPPPVRSDHSKASVGESASREGFSIEYTEITFMKKIGIGGFGEVWKGEWAGTSVAIKKIHNPDITEQDLKEFSAEILLMR